MSLMTYKKSVLKILAENLKKAQPPLVDSAVIAEILHISIRETCQLIRIMDAMGFVESDQEGQRSLITRQGMLYLNTIELAKAA